MDVLNDELINIECLNHDGDERVSPFELLLWHFCVQAGRAFDTDEVVFQYLPTGDVGDPLEQIEFFVPRDHPRVADIEAFLIKVVRPICEVIAASKLKMDPGHMGVYVYLYRYSGIVGALAFIEAHEEVMRAGEELNHPDWGRLTDVALDEGRKAAQLTKRHRLGMPLRRKP